MTWGEPFIVNSSLPGVISRFIFDVGSGADVVGGVDVLSSVDVAGRIACGNN